MRRPIFFALCFSACYGGASIDVVTGEQPQEPGVEAPGGSDLPGQGPGPSVPTPGPTVPGAPSGLPCDVAQLLASKCQSCHRSPPSGAPMALMTREHLLAPAPSDPSRTVAAVSVERMKSTVRPMPPGAPASAQEIAVLEAWVTAGTPAGDCGGSSSADGGSMPATPPQPAPTVCTSGDFWTRGVDGSELMFPGRSCQGCHRTDDDAPRLTIAGTVFPTLHEKNDCYGDKDVVVEITDALGVIVRLTSNNYGNFRSSAPITPPIRAKLIFDGRVREMVTPQPTGDCNSCHTEQGANGAPGRILKP